MPEEFVSYTCKIRTGVVFSHVLRHGGVGDGWGGRLQAALAAHAAAVAAEAVHVGVVGVLRAGPPRPRVERVLLVNVVVILFPIEGKISGVTSAVNFPVIRQTLCNCAAGRKLA